MSEPHALPLIDGGIVSVPAVIGGTAVAGKAAAAIAAVVAPAIKVIPAVAAGLLGWFIGESTDVIEGRKRKIYKNIVTLSTFLDKSDDYEKLFPIHILLNEQEILFRHDQWNIPSMFGRLESVVGSPDLNPICYKSKIIV